MITDFRKRSSLQRVALTLPILFSVFNSAVAEEQLSYRITDPDLEIVRIDTSETESFLSVCVDSLGRVFVGSREALFVYEPIPDGSYGSPQELFRFPADSWIYDIEVRGSDVYTMTNHALYMLRGAVIKRDNLRAERLLWGHPDGGEHQCLHGLAWGPEGDLYMSMGDILVGYGDFSRPDHWGHWTFMTKPEGTRVPFTGVGGFMRCHPDGSNFQVVARGTRNSCGIVFDSHWNLFSHDNDHEGVPTNYTPGRLLHVTPHADFAWPRGWMVSKTPERADLLETMFSGMGRAVPVGQSYYDDQYLPEKYRNSLLLARWGNRTISYYPIRNRGASFSAEEHVLLRGVDQARPVGVTVGRGGRIFATISYMAHNEASPTYRSDLIMITRKDDTKNHPFKGYEASTASEELLWSELAHPSTWRSRRAFVELMRRGQTPEGEHFSAVALRKLQESLRAEPQSVATHLVWLAAKFGHDSKPRSDVGLVLNELAKSNSPNLRFQALRALVEFFPGDSHFPDLLTAFLQDTNPQCRHAAVVGLFQFDRIPEALFSGPSQSEDSYIRQASAQVIAEKCSVAQIADLCRSEEPRVRLAGVLAAGFRLTIPPAIGPFDESLPLQPWPNEKEYLVDYDRETVDVRTLGPVGIFTTAEHWAAGNHTPEQEELFELLLEQLNDEDAQVCLQAAHFLFLLDDARAEPLIEKVRNVSERKRLDVAEIEEVNTVWTIGPFSDRGGGFKTIHPPETGAVDLSAEYPDSGRRLTWEKYTKDPVFDFRNKFGESDDTSRYVYFRFNSNKKQQVMLTPGSDDGMRVWHNGTLVYEIDETRGALPLQDVIYLTLAPGSNDILIRVRNIVDAHMLYIHYRAIDAVSWSLPEKIDTASLAERLRAGTENGGTVSRELLDTDWIKAALQGDPQRGRQLFSADGIGCAKCHSAETEGTSGAPSLAAAGNRFTVPYLVESILLPSKTIAPAFKGDLILTDSGLTHTGLVIKETAKSIVLLTADAKAVEINKSEIEVRKEMDASPMPNGLIKDAGELRDLLAYLTRLKE